MALELTDGEVAILTAVVSGFAATLGYLFREYRNRAKPFLSITHVSGGLRKLNDRVEIPLDTVRRLEGSSYIEALNANVELRDLQEVVEDCRRIRDHGEPLLVDLGAVVEACDSGSETRVVGSLAKVCDRRFFDDFVLTLLQGGNLRIPRLPRNAKLKLEMRDQTATDGVIWIAFPGRLLPLGELPSGRMGLKELQVLHDRYLRFLKPILAMDIDILRNVFGQLKGFLESELSIARATLPEVEPIRNGRARFAIRIYVANLGRTPFIVQRRARLFVEDPATGARFEEASYLLLVDEAKDGGETFEDTTLPLVIPSEKDETIAYATIDAESKMKTGKALRESLERGKARCWLEFELRQAGLFGKRTVRTPSARFAEDATD